MQNLLFTSGEIYFVVLQKIEINTTLLVIKLLYFESIFSNCQTSFAIFGGMVRYVIGVLLARVKFY